MIYPVEHALSAESPSLHLPYPYASWGSKNGRIEQKSWKKRWGYNTADRTLTDHTPYAVILYQLKGGTRNTMYLTASDLIKRETSAGKTWSYKTTITTYTSKVVSISGSTVTLSEGETPATDGVADGDYFILYNDFTADEEPHRVLAYVTGNKGTGDTPDVGDSVTGGTSGATGKIKLLTTTSGAWASGTAAGDLILTTVKGTFIDEEVLTFKDGETAAASGTGTATWASIASASDDNHNITLDANYPGSTGDWTGSERTGYVRHVYTTPKNHRWSWCIVDDVLVFTNGDTAVQYWDNADYGTDLETAKTVAVQAHYCIEYADRLFIADYGAVRAPTKIAWSANGDPTDWTSSTAGSAELLGSDNYIMGLGKVGNDLIVYRLYSIMVGNRTGDAVTPVIFPREYKEVECAAPWSIVDAAGSNFFIGRNDFYRLSPGPSVVSIGGPIRDKFFSIVDWTEIEKTWGQQYALRGEVEWIANTAEGKFGFVYNYKMNEWAVNEYRHDICAAGKGAV